jgi:hypothetical protein
MQNKEEKIEAKIFVNPNLLYSKDINIVIDITQQLLRKILTTSYVEFPNGIRVLNTLSLDERIRLGNWYMEYLAKEIGEINAPMKRKDLITLLQSFDKFDPEGKMECVFGNNEVLLEIENVDLGKSGDEDVVVIS